MTIVTQERVAHLTDLPDDGKFYLWGDETPMLVKRLDDVRYVGIMPFLFTWAIVVGNVADEYGYEDRWCYGSLLAATAAANVWNGTGEPEGWHRHPATGRRRPDGDPTQEYVSP